MKIKSLLTFATLVLTDTISALAMPRTAAPDFKNVNSVSNGEFKPVSLSDYKGKYLVMVFYPFDFTYVCPTELIAFSE